MKPVVSEFFPSDQLKIRTLSYYTMVTIITSSLVCQGTLGPVMSVGDVLNLTTMRDDTRAPTIQTTARRVYKTIAQITWKPSADGNERLYYAYPVNGSSMGTYVCNNIWRDPTTVKPSMSRMSAYALIAANVSDA